MSKELEALENIRYLIVFDERVVDEYGDEEPIKIFLDEELPEDYKIIEKSLKALEIIKTKNVFVWGFIHRQEEIKDFEWTYDYYKTHCGYFHSGYDYELLTEEEYDLLREVLL